MSDEVEILLVEDNPTDAEMTIRVLKKNNLGNKLLHLKDGVEALDFLFAEGEYTGRQQEDIPKVILLDLKMPKINGIELLVKIKSDVRTKKIPVVVLTSSRENSDIQTCYNLGVNGYVVKPVDFDAFHKTISALGIYWIIANEAPH